MKEKLYDTWTWSEVTTQFLLTESLKHQVEVHDIIIAGEFDFIFCVLIVAFPKKKYTENI